MTSDILNTISPRIVSKTWGEERIFYNAEYSAKCLIILPKQSTSLHYHPVKDETMTVVSGFAEILLGNHLNYSEYFLSTLDSFRIPPGVSHKIHNPSDSKNLIIIESATHDDPRDSIRIKNV